MVLTGEQRQQLAGTVIIIISYGSVPRCRSLGITTLCEGRPSLTTTRSTTTSRTKIGCLRLLLSVACYVACATGGVFLTRPKKDKRCTDTYILEPRIVVGACMLVHTGMSLACLSTHRHDACCIKTLAIGFEEKREKPRSCWHARWRIDTLRVLVP